MPPRYAYWTIILDGAPTSFRTKEREEILPLFNQLKAKNPAALLKWFSGGKIWDSPDQAREARAVEKVRAFREQRSQQAKAEREGGEDPLAEFRKQHGRPADGSDQPSSPGSPPRPGSGQADPGASDPLAEFRRQHGRPADGSDQRPPVPPTWSPASEDRGAPRVPRREGRGAGAPDRRGKDWRPGGEHKDPRDKYKLPPGEARKRWKDRNLGPGRPLSTRDGDDRSLRPGKPPFGDSPRGDSPRSDRPWSNRPRGPMPFGGKPSGSKPAGDRPFSGKPRGPGGGRPWGAPGAGGRGAFPSRGGRTGEGHPSTEGNGPDRTRDRKPSGDRPWGDRPRGPKPFGSKPSGSTPAGDRPWSDRPRGPKPFGSKPFGSKPAGPGGPRKFGGKPGPGGPRPFRGKPGKPGGPRGKR